MKPQAADVESAGLDQQVSVAPRPRVQVLAPVAPGENHFEVLSFVMSWCIVGILLGILLAATVGAVANSPLPGLFAFIAGSVGYFYWRMRWGGSRKADAEGAETIDYAAVQERVDEMLIQIEKLSAPITPEFRLSDSNRRDPERDALLDLLVRTILAQTQIAAAVSKLRAEMGAWKDSADGKALRQAHEKGSVQPNESDVPAALEAGATES